MIKSQNMKESHNYIFKNDPTSSHLRIASWIKKLKRKTILDVGCAGGFLATALDSKKYQIIGIDKDTSWRDSKALREYEKVYWIDLEKTDFKELEGQRFDFIVCADILEHLNNRKKILEKLKNLLRDDGYLVVCIPNMDLLPFLIVHKLFPNFRMDKGPLDRTHKGVSTFASFYPLITRYYIIQEIEITPPPLMAAFGKLSETTVFKFINKIDLRLAKLLPRYFAFQYIFIARPKSNVH